MKRPVRRLSRRPPSRATEEWDERVAREAGCQARIEAAFDRADQFYSAGDVEPALECLQAAEEMSGALPPAYRARRAQLVCDLASERERAASR